MAMYESLVKHCDDFHLYIFAFDDKTKEYLSSQNFEHITVISLKEFEDAELLRIKPTRTAGEYCWTSTSSTILYSINTFQLDHCTYIDADLMFYSNPKVLIEEMGSKSVLITSHRYTKDYDQSIESGKYCVQFVLFKNNEQGMKVLNWWRNACIEWCYNRIEDGKFGDQKYLDDWTRRFEGVHELEHLGGGVAPWNVQQYTFRETNGYYKGTEIATGKQFDLVFFHFHGVKFYENDVVSLTGQLYSITNAIQNQLYKPYVNALCKVKDKIETIDSTINANGISGQASYLPMSFKLKIRIYLSGLRQSLKNINITYLKTRVAHHYFYYCRDFKNE